MVDILIESLILVEPMAETTTVSVDRLVVAVRLIVVVWMSYVYLKLIKK
jgi:hypothetical protein